jgi:hypothetical protein
MAGAAAAAASGANAPNVAVSPTAAATTQNMQALAGLGFTTPVNYRALSRPWRTGM